MCLISAITSYLLPLDALIACSIKWCTCVRSRMRVSNSMLIRDQISSMLLSVSPILLWNFFILVHSWRKSACFVFRSLPSNGSLSPWSVIFYPFYPISTSFGIFSAVKEVINLAALNGILEEQGSTPQDV